MTRTRSRHAGATAALALVEELQARFKLGLEAAARELDPDTDTDTDGFSTHEWLRDGGRHGGGMRWATAQTPVFNRAAINVSHVHYDDDPGRRLGSATALSTIIHPDHPRAPSIHVHVSWTQIKAGPGYWRVMADLNPAIPDPHATEAFARRLHEAAPAVYEQARAQGQRYFWIPALGRHRGATHFYLEAYQTGDLDADRALAASVGRAALDGYVALLSAKLRDRSPPSKAERAEQLGYHTLYLYQVLTLDRGTTSGLLVHDQNDVGIMGSLPALVDRQLLASWEPATPELQRPLVRAIVDALPDASPSPVDDPTRARLAEILRAHYRTHPEAADLLASGDVLPPTVTNHHNSQKSSR